MLHMWVVKPEPVASGDVTTEELPPVVLSDPRDIRALAHPARMAVIEELYSGRELTATECAAIAGLSPSAMSYHLRSLERAGIVVRAESGDARERPWRAAGSHLQVRGGSGPGGMAASAALGSTVIGRTTEGFAKWLERRPAESEEWRERGGTATGQVWVTSDEVEELQKQFLDATDRYLRRRADNHPEGARRVRFALFMFPVDSTDPVDAADPASADKIGQ
jgi:DNA-binding transcriptional ArsR family regulator